VLIEGVPGTGKTLIVRSLAEVLNLSFNRIQFTVDLMPADITVRVWSWIEKRADASLFLSKGRFSPYPAGG